MADVEFRIENDQVLRLTPVQDCGEGFYKADVVIDKETFVKCCKEWLGTAGDWLPHQEGKWIYAKCSKCGSVHNVPSSFCPTCGSIMDDASFREHLKREEVE